MLYGVKLTAAAAMLATLLGGCATITSGKDQTLSFDTDPAGAECTLVQSGVDVARFKTPRMLTIHRANSPLIVACSKPGYQETRAMIASTISDGAWGNLLVGGIVGVMVDQSSGAAYRYYDPPRLALIAAGETPPESSRLLAKGVTLLPPSTGPTPPSPPPEPAFETATAPSSTVAAPARPAGTPPAAGVWECGLKSGSRHYKLQFVVAANHSMVVTSYANAPATVVNNEPLTLTALNPRGDRPMNIVWNTDNTMVITGPSSTAPSGSFHNEGTCAKM